MRKSNIVILSLILFCLAGMTGSRVLAKTIQGETAVARPTQSITAINQSDETGLHFTLQTPAAASVEGVIQVDGLTARVQELGAPALPYFVTYVAVPPQATVAVRVTARVETNTRLPDGVTAVPQPAASIDDIPQLADEAFASTQENGLLSQPPPRVNAPNPDIYQKDAPYPEAIYTVSQPMYYRDIRLVELRLYPVRYNPVTQELWQAAQLDVAIQFVGAQWSPVRPSPTPDDFYLQALSGAIMNFDQVGEWRSLPANLIDTPATNFPTLAAETYKIVVSQDGIYQISRADLQAQGMNVGAVNPKTIEMMYRGQPVAYQLVNDDGDNVFDANEAIRFYGWAFDGPRAEKQFVTNNVFWLWAGGTGTAVTSRDQSGGDTVTSLMAELTVEPETYFTTTYTDQWDSFPNEPDGWYWDFVQQGDPLQPLAPITMTYPITLPNPAAVGPAATYTVELLSRERSTNPTGITYDVRSYVNNYTGYGEAIWTGKKSVNIVHSVPLAELNDPANAVHLVFDSSSNLAQIYLNRITFAYQRRLTAINDELIFTDDTGGSRTFQISGFTENNVNNVIVWDITDPALPEQITLSSGDISGGTYTVGSTHPADARFIATTTANTLSPTISQYIPASLTPPAGGADWLAISHADFLTAAQTLADHRANELFGGLSTWVIDIEDVVNQYGYGLPLPAAINDYLAYALGNWSTAPGYVTLFGAATMNPRQLDCQHWSCPGNSETNIVWDKDQATYVVTDLVYADRFQGLIPSDHPMVLLSGNDLLPDMAIGRITAETAVEADAAVTKIIKYEQNLASSAAWKNDMLFVADNADAGGNFYLENQITAAEHIHPFFTINQLYLTTATTTETDTLRANMLARINNEGIAVLNYRGHGSVTLWASPAIISSSSASTALWNNAQKPVVILSADCLDGNFAFPGLAALSKTLLTLPVGSAAHWSSTGLGYTSEHSVLHRSFYDGLFEQNLLTIGDAINYAKLIYDQGGYHESEMYSFLLQGDPAMQMLPFFYDLYLPVTIK